MLLRERWVNVCRGEGIWVLRSKIERVGSEFEKVNGVEEVGIEGDTDDLVW